VYIHVRLSEQFSESEAAFYGTTLKVIGGCQKAGTSSSKRVNGWVSTISKGFIELNRNFNFEFIHKTTAKICENHNKRAFTKYPNHFDF
jgi:hypothetical protein